jgi:hypothetical protein
VPTVARGKALVAKLRQQAGVVDAEALAAYLGRFKKARKAGASPAEARKAARGGKEKRKLSTSERARRKSDPDDPFAEDYGPNEAETPEQKRQRKMEEAILRKMEKEDRSNLYNAVMEQGGIKPSGELQEEYRQIPKHLKRKDGLAGDQMAEYLATYYAELGIRDENDLLDYFAPDYRRAA